MGIRKIFNLLLITALILPTVGVAVIRVKITKNVGTAIRVAKITSLLYAGNYCQNALRQNALRQKARPSKHLDRQPGGFGNEDPAQQSIYEAGLNSKDVSVVLGAVLFSDLAAIFLDERFKKPLLYFSNRGLFISFTNFLVTRPFFRDSLIGLGLGSFLVCNRYVAHKKGGANIVGCDGVCSGCVLTNGMASYSIYELGKAILNRYIVFESGDQDKNDDNYDAEFRHKRSKKSRKSRKRPAIDKRRDYEDYEEDEEDYEDGEDDDEDEEFQDSKKKRTILEELKKGNELLSSSRL